MSGNHEQQSISARISFVDALRGYALVGLFLVHMTGYFELYNARPEPSWVQETTRFLFQGKSFSLLALCFGFSFHVQLGGAKRRGEPFGLRFGWRMALLLAIGWAHALLYRGDILMVLAVSGLLLIPLDRIRSPRLLLGVAAALLLQPLLLVRIVAGHAGADWAMAEPLFYDDGGALAPSLSGSFGALVQANIRSGSVAKWSYFIETGRILQVIGLFLVGMQLARSGVFAAPARFTRVLAGALAVALVALAPLLLARAETCCHSTGPIYWTNILVSGWIDLAGTAIAFVLFAGLWALGSGRMLGVLAPAGRMTLTLYVGQSLVFVPVFYGFGLHLWDRITQEQALLLGVMAAAAQIAGAHLWFRWFAYGPLEWLWRAGTRLSLDIPFLRAREPLKRASS